MPVSSMAGVSQTSVDELRARRDALPRRRASAACCCSAFPTTRTTKGPSAWDEQGPVQQAVRALKRELPQLVVITDVCMCEYTVHGHCGVLANGEVDNDAHARAARARGGVACAGGRGHRGAERHDGRSRRRDSCARSTRRGSRSTSILSYAAKFAATFYGPFREAAESTPQSGDRRGYQMDAAQRRRSAARDLAGHRGGRRHGDGEAGGSVPRRHRAREGARRATRSPRTR